MKREAQSTVPKFKKRHPPAVVGNRHSDVEVLRSKGISRSTRGVLERALRLQDLGRQDLGRLVGGSGAL